MTTQIIKCNCVSAFQDGMYGEGNRVANLMRTGQLKCTVCSTISGSKGIVVNPKLEKVVSKADIEVKTKEEFKKEKDDKKDNKKGSKKEKKSGKEKNIKGKVNRR